MERVRCAPTACRCRSSKFGNVEIAGAYTPRSSPPRSTRTRALTRRLLSRALGLGAEVGDRVAAHRRRLAAGEPHLAPGRVARRRRERDRDHDDTDVHERARRTAAGCARTMRAVATGHRLAMRAPPGPHADRDGAADAREREGGEREREDLRDARARRARARTTSVMPPAHAGTSRRRRRSSPLAARHGSSGPTAMRNSSAMPIGTRHPLEVRLADRQLAVLERLGEQREHRAGEHDERERGEQQVVEQERGLARHRRVDAARRAQRVAAPRDERDAGRSRRHRGTSAATARSATA